MDSTESFSETFLIWTVLKGFYWNLSNMGQYWKVFIETFLI